MNEDIKALINYIPVLYLATVPAGILFIGLEKTASIVVLIGAVVYMFDFYLQVRD